MALATVARKTITFSLVAIPVTVHAATEHHRVPLHRVHAADGGRARQPTVCSIDGRELRPDEVARGYELPGGDMLVLTDEDLADLPTPDASQIRVLGFLPAERIDPIHYDRVYYLGCSGLAARPYALLREALERSGQLAVARTALRTRDSLVVLGVRGSTITMTTLLWPGEIRDPASLAPEASPPPRQEEVDMALQLMDAVSGDWRMEDERDEYTRALQELVDARIAGLPAPEGGRVLPLASGDLMAVLEASVAKAREDKTPAKKPERNPDKPQ